MMKRNHANSLLGDISVCDPPDSIPNSEVKASCADDSMGSPHVKVGHRQAFKFKRPQPKRVGAFCVRE